VQGGSFAFIAWQLAVEIGERLRLIQVRSVLRKPV
jgi:hypothetical protein